MTSLLRNIIGAAWRRRYLILFPFLLLATLSLAATIMLPKTYTTSALILLQEEGGSNPLGASGSRGRDTRARVAALEALLKSDRVLSEVVKRHHGADPATAPAYAALQLELLRERLTLRIVGGHFIEISLTGSKPVALKDELDEVVERLFELLLVPSSATMSATDFLIKRQELSIVALNAKLTEVTKAAGDLSPLALGEKRAKRDEAAAALKAARAEAKEADAQLREAAFAVLGPKTALRSLDGEIADLKAKLEDASGVEAEKLRKQIDALEVVRPVEARAAAKKLVAEKAAAQLALAGRELSEHVRNLSAKEKIAARLAAARKALAESRSRFRSQREKTLFILAAPDQLKLVDVPQVPKRPTRSALKILIAGIAAGIGLGCGLAVLAEQLDQSIRGEEDLGGETELPVLARLPRLREREKKALASYGLMGRREPPPTADLRTSAMEPKGEPKQTVVM
ncbi:MAG: Wzz/FepE/Etk N-terminal domain-containing protein [Neomegalonema sp.]|nr:Wzz/FepE/Etk N-terminal domain-containing protein [Neomegalonema sp.]